MATTHVSPVFNPSKSECSAQATQATQASLAPLASQNEFYAFASMVLAGLPFPPLPVMVQQGEDGEYAIASSFDLLQQAIVAQQVAQQAGHVIAGNCAADVVASKTAILQQLLHDMTAHVQDALENEKLHQDAFVEKAYDIYCSAFRAYLLKNYPVCSQDLRFYPMADVSKTHTLIDHARSHLQASFIMSGCGDSAAGGAPVPSPVLSRVLSPFDGLVGTAGPSYADVIRFYAHDLGSLT